MNINEMKENRAKSILQYAVPSILAMLLTACITVTDGYFAGNFVGKEGITAINLGLPILYFFLGIGLMIGVGGNVLAVNEVGKKNTQKANSIFCQTIFTSLMICVVLSIITLLCLEPITHLLHVEGLTADYFKDYYRIMLLDFPLLTTGTCLGMFIRADGKPQISMMVSIIGAVFNVLLDYVFVAKCNLGITGIAIASLLVVVVQTLIQVLYFVKCSNTFMYKRIRFDINVLKQSMLNGFSEFIGEMASCLSMFCFNLVIMKYVGIPGVAAFSILGYVVYVHSMVVIGFGQGMSPLVGFLNGAGEEDLAKDIRKTTNRMVLAVGFVVAVILFSCGDGYAKMFVSDETIIEMVASGFIIFSITFIVTGYNVIGSMYFTSCKKAGPSALISALRGVILLLPLIFLFPALWGMVGVWLITPVTEIVTCLITGLLIMKTEKYTMKGKIEIV